MGKNVDLLRQQYDANPFFFPRMDRMHDRKNFDKLIKTAKELGFKVQTRNNKVFVFHFDPKKGCRSCHPDEKGFHDLRRFIYK